MSLNLSHFSQMTHAESSVYLRLRLKSAAEKFYPL